jgi:hypothetical protein
MSKQIALRESRAVALVANAELVEAVSAFGGYVDPAGNVATSPAGLMKSFNKAVKREFGMAVDDMPEDMQLHVASLRSRVSALILDGMRRGMLRTDIKAQIRESVKVSAAAYLMMTGASRDRH